jgi:hypothetical protein
MQEAGAQAPARSDSEIDNSVGGLDCDDERSKGLRSFGCIADQRFKDRAIRSNSRSGQTEYRRRAALCGLGSSDRKAEDRESPDDHLS